MDIETFTKTLIEIKEKLLAKDPDMRYAVCLFCDQFNNEIKTCKKCGCFMPAKTKLKAANCPIGKW